MARLCMVLVLVHGLHVGSETLPPLTNATKGTMAERAQRYSSRGGAATNKRTEADDIDNTSSSSTALSSLSNKSRFQNLAGAMTRLNLLIATWPFFVFVGQNMTLALSPIGAWTWTGLPYLLLSGLLILKAYRFHLWTLQTTKHPEDDDGGAAR
jgi:hypothetical protein